MDEPIVKPDATSIAFEFSVRCSVVHELGPCAAGQPLLNVAQQLAQGHVVFQQGHQQISQAIALSTHPHLTPASMPGPPSGVQQSFQASASQACLVDDSTACMGATWAPYLTTVPDLRPDPQFSQLDCICIMIDGK